jgi:hypothetical protein
MCSHSNVKASSGQQKMEFLVRGFVAKSNNTIREKRKSTHYSSCLHFFSFYNSSDADSPENYTLSCFIRSSESWKIVLWWNQHGDRCILLLQDPRRELHTTTCDLSVEKERRWYFVKGGNRFLTLWSISEFSLFHRPFSTSLNKMRRERRRLSQPITRNNMIPMWIFIVSLV